MQGTGKKVAASGLTIQRVDEGKIVEGWTHFDTLGMLQQIDVVPPPE
jgi:predicted ester cyclase